MLGDHSSFRAEVDALPDGSWVVIDEVQRIPSLLRQVHDIISLRGAGIRFALSGSSARKLRRLDVDMLAGRAIERRLFPLTRVEIGDGFELNRALQFGTLPTVWLDPNYAVDILEAYVSTYLNQEIQREALVDDIGSFHRFLRVAAILNGATLNLSSVARDAGVARSAVGRYFDTLVDTLVAFRLEGWQPRAKVRETHAPKVYFFDPGVVRALLAACVTRSGKTRPASCWRPTCSKRSARPWPITRVGVSSSTGGVAQSSRWTLFGSEPTSRLASK